jgi:transposase
MDGSLLLSPALALRAPKSNWDTPTRAKIRVLAQEGLSQREIGRKFGIAQATVNRIVNSKSSRRTRKGKVYKPTLISKREVRCIIRYISNSWEGRRVTYPQIKIACHIDASATTIRRALKRAGYQRCIACPRPFINAKAVKKRLDFARKHRWWSIQQWKVVIWSDEATFETGKRGRVWVTRRTDEKACPNCIKSIYRSGRTSVMIWGALGWDWKSPLIFMEKKPDKKGICSQAYLEQCLETVIFPWYDSLNEAQKAEAIFMEDGTKVHKGNARLPRLNKGIRGFDWPPCSPDLNPIEKVWRWMKEEITKMIDLPTTIEDLKKVLQELWDRVEPEDYRCYTARLTCKLEDVIKVKGMATIH